MENDRNEQLDDSYDDEQEVKLTRMQKRLYHTVLGQYLITKQSRYLAAFFLFLATYVLVAGMFISVISSGSIHSNLIMVLAFAATSHTIGNVAAGRDRMAFMSLVATIFLWVLVSVKP